MVTNFFIWLGKTLATIGLTVVITLWLTGLIMTSVVQSILKEYEIPLQIEPAIYTGVLGYLWGFQQAEINSTITLDTDIPSIEQKSNPPYTVTNQLESEPGSIEEKDAIEALAPVELEEKVEISNNELEQKRDNLTDTDKERILQLVVEKIPADQWQLISLYIEDGLSETELLETQQILAQYLSDSEYSELMAILKKS